MWVPIVITLLIIGVFLWLANTYIADARIKSILNVVTMIVVVLWLLGAFKIIGALNMVAMPPPVDYSQPLRF